MPSTNEVLQEGRYRIDHQFPINGQGSIFDAYDTVRDTKVLVKEIVVKMNRVTTAAQQEQMQVTFANQAKVLTSIKHETLLSVHDFFSEVGRQFLVMESVDGQSLADLLAKNAGGLPFNNVIRWADEVLDGLVYLHNFKPSIIHKNIRPENIKLTSSGRVKLFAFGLADGSTTEISTASVPSYDESDISYSPLEQIWSGLDSASQRVIVDSYGEQEERSLMSPPDARSDIYSLGATLYHVLTGRKPLSALERSIEMLDGNNDPLAAPNSVNPSVPAALSTMVLKAMQIRRDDRFGSAAEMMDALRSAFSSEFTAAASAAPDAEVEAKRREAEQRVQELRAAAAERLRREKEEQAAGSQASAAGPVEAPAEILEVPATATAAPVATAPAVLSIHDTSADVPEQFAAPEEDDAEPFSYGTESRSSLSMAAIGGGLALVVVIAVGIWFALSSGSATPEPVSTQPAVQQGAVPEQPAAVDPAPVAQDQAVAPEQQAVDESTAQPAAQDPAQTAAAKKAQPTAAAKRSAADAPKAPEKKKALTVDDLINDN
ncbi:MAG: protein kinase [Pyrinomonadaceae bacterium]|nr:protein kinase [Pyrinomonadaceae bacterium]